MSWLDTLEGLYRRRDFSNLPPEEQERAARDVVNLAALSSCAVVAAPIPLTDLLLATPIHVAMVVAVGHVYGRSLSRAEAQALFLELAAAAGASVAARHLWITLSKIIAPGIGGYLFLPYVYAVTWAMGRMAMAYFERPDARPEDLRGKFGDFVKEGKRAFSMDALKDFMRRRGSGVHGPGAEGAPEEAGAAAGAADADAAPSASPAAVEACWDEDSPQATGASAAEKQRTPATKRAPGRKPKKGTAGKPAKKKPAKGAARKRPAKTSKTR